MGDKHIYRGTERGMCLVPASPRGLKPGCTVTSQNTRASYQNHFGRGKEGLRILKADVSPKWRHDWEYRLQTRNETLLDFPE
jgi:hypothetical protein